jgi:hypothetical protein
VAVGADVVGGEHLAPDAVQRDVVAVDRDPEHVVGGQLVGSEGVDPADFAHIG